MSVGLKMLQKSCFLRYLIIFAIFQMSTCIEGSTKRIVVSLCEGVPR